MLKDIQDRLNSQIKKVVGIEQSVSDIWGLDIHIIASVNLSGEYNSETLTAIKNCFAELVKAINDLVDTSNIFGLEIDEMLPISPLSMSNLSLAAFTHAVIKKLDEIDATLNKLEKIFK